MSLIKDFAKLAGVKTTGPEKVVEKQEEDFSSEELKVVRAAVVGTIKQLEKEARETNSPSLTRLYKQDADVYDSILDAVLKGKQPIAARLWAKQDTSCRDHLFDNTKDVPVKKVLAKYFGATLLHDENEEEMVEIDEGSVGTLRRKINNRIGHIDSRLKDMARNKTGVEPEINPTKQKALIQKFVKGMDPKDAEDKIEKLVAVPKHRRGLKEEDYEESHQILETKNNDVKFYVVLTATKNSEFGDIFGEVSMQGLKNLVLGTPKEEIADLAIFPASMKQEARDLAMKRWHDAKPAPEEEEVSNEKVNKNSELAHLDFRVHLKYGDKWERWEAFASEGRAHTEGKKMVADSSATEYKVVKEAEQLDEISKKTLASYIKKAVDDVSYNSFIAGDESARSIFIKDRSHARSMEADKKSMKRQRGVEKALDKLTKENEETKVIPLDVEQGDLEKQTEMKPETEKVPAEVFADINKVIKEIKFKVDHMSHIDPTYQEHGYWFQFMVLLQQIADMLKQGTDEAFKEAATKLQSFENVALVQVPDSLWKFLSVDMYKPAEKRKGPSLSAKFQEVKKGE